MLVPGKRLLSQGGFCSGMISPHSGVVPGACAGCGSSLRSCISHHVTDGGNHGMCGVFSFFTETPKVTARAEIC